ncbi:ras-related protein Rap-2a [Hydra vulgaris]|uniref:ras-related protein Rap-2a n=1 Tax=Hydra vulgaris TaxID=6087 RepID=UPI0001924085|nr:ras-related protein Rap-2a [Hydra vulgaris]XP_047134158.1 ras-related protein Rap-2a [Hydra vulgaris]
MEESFEKLKNIVFRREKEPIRIVVLGSPGVGKTALIIRCLTNQFFNHYVPGKEEAYKYTVNVGANKAQLDIMDSKGKNTALISHADAVILVYSVIDKESFENIKTLIKNVRDLNLNNIPIIVVGNKNDLPKKRQVSKTDAGLLSASYNVKVFESSAAVPVHDVRNIFAEVCRLVFEEKKERRESDPTDPLRRMTLNDITRKNSLSLDSTDFIKLVL